MKYLAILNSILMLAFCFVKNENQFLWTNLLTTLKIRFYKNYWRF